MSSSSGAIHSARSIGVVIGHAGTQRPAGESPVRSKVREAPIHRPARRPLECSRALKNSPFQGALPRINGMSSGSMAALRTFNSREDMEQALLRYVALYNHQLPQLALTSKNAYAGPERVVPDAPASVPQVTI